MTERDLSPSEYVLGLLMVAIFIAAVGAAVTWALLTFTTLGSCGTHLVNGTLYTVVCP